MNSKTKKLVIQGIINTIIFFALIFNLFWVRDIETTWLKWLITIPIAILGFMFMMIASMNFAKAFKNQLDYDASNLLQKEWDNKMNKLQIVGYILGAIFIILAQVVLHS